MLTQQKSAHRVSEEGSTGAIGRMVLNLCDDAHERLTKAAFIRLAQATARILLGRAAPTNH
jgi:hypothetical protein